jgi:hypothetical protein
MTGNNKLLAILGNYKPAPWRGRYSLSRLFFNFYLLVMGSFVAIAIFADFVISTAVKGNYRRLHQSFHARHRSADRGGAFPEATFGVAENDRGT